MAYCFLFIGMSSQKKYGEGFQQYSPDIDIPCYNHIVGEHGVPWVRRASWAVRIQVRSGHSEIDQLIYQASLSLKQYDYSQNIILVA